MKPKHHILKSGILLTAMAITVILAASCSTRKNTGLNRAYHTTTSHFNINFNAKEALKKAEAEIANVTKDNYTITLPVYAYPSKEAITSALPSLDRTIEKSSKSIFKHSIFIKGKEYVKTMDDAYLLMGKAYFYKQDYQQAQRVFNYIISTHKNGNCKEEAAVWLTRCFIRQKYFPRAETSLDEALYLIYPKKDKKLNVLYHASAAEYHLTAPNGDREAAIDHIKDALKNKPKKEFRTRLNFILGQLYEGADMPSEAHASFKRVLKSSPAYDMEFSARMHLASNYDGTEASKTAILKEMKKMLKETKNEKFKDQIYYAISELYRRDEDIDAQIEYLALSVSSYVDNDYQRSYSSLKLADIYFEDEEYPLAQAYYDTATLALPKDYPNYKAIMHKTKTLTELVQNLQVIKTQDSLQRIAKMSEGERKSWVSQQIRAYKAAEAKKQQNDANKELAIQNALGMSNIYANNASTQGGKWYFYNTSLVSAGRTEFLKRWGTRKLEDNWRVSNKQQISFDELADLNNPNSSADEEDTVTSGRSNNPKEEKYYLQDVPLTKGALDTSNNKIANAMYNAALIYIDMLKDQKKGNATLENLVARFPDHELALPALYILYLNYKNANDPRAETPKNVILSKYPQTDYAKLILDPHYNEKLAEAAKIIEKKYEEAYGAYSAKQWQKTITISDEALPLCKDTVLTTKFLYIRAIALGQTKGEKEMKEEMFRIVSNYPMSKVAELAKLFLQPENKESDKSSQGKKSTDALNGKNGAKAGADNDENPFIVAPAEQHFIIMLINVHKIKGTVVDIKNDISAFNREIYSLLKLNISSIYLNQNEQILTIAKFKNKETAMDYYNNIVKDPKFSAYNKSKAIITYAISATNYTTYYNKEEKREMYNKFFEENYLK
ncbi:MAG: tetratricopeptide repeat protein [Bacteroidales bacterium]|nr:tetratricopeptide repeat protein [Bacteroidales bacterium]